MVNPPLTIAVLGLGEAGSLIAWDLVAAGAVVRGYDPAVAPGPGITERYARCSSRWALTSRC
jgi:3-hydroxyisobutyrate dehydrogenase-like beta-hydroxyacid dehydrogenase